MLGGAIDAHSQGSALTWDDLQDKFECPEWFADARFGIWLHWGAEAQPTEGGGWYARHMYMPDVKDEDWGKYAYRYQCETYGHPSEMGYKEVLDSWKAEKLDPDSLTAYIKGLGAKYFLVLANHHDHFDNFNSTYHPWNSVNVGPKRDIVGEFEKSAKKHDIPFGVSSHDDRFMWWFLPAFGHDESGRYANVPYDGHHTKADGIGKWWEGLDLADLYGLPPEKRTPEWEESVKRNWLQRHTELVTKYDVDILWFDGYGFPYGDYGKELCAAYYNHLLDKHGKIDGVVVGKIANEPSTIKDIERGTANKILPDVWQGTITPRTWFYKTEQPFRHSARTIIEMMADMNSKNGNMLLNIELLPDGSIPAEQRIILDAVGAWVNLNAEAIYGSKPWKVYGDNLNSILEELRNKQNPSEADLAMLEKMEAAGGGEQFNERNLQSPPYGNSEVRFTTNDGNLYVFVLNPAAGEISLPSLGLSSEHEPGAIRKISMIGGGDVKFDQRDDRLVMEVPASRPNRYATVFRVEFE